MFFAAFRGINILIDGLVTDRRFGVWLYLQATRNLFRCPTILQSLNDIASQRFKSIQLATMAASVPCDVVRRHRPISVCITELTIMPVVASDFAGDRGTVTTQVTGNIRLTELLVPHPKYRFTLFKT